MNNRLMGVAAAALLTVAAVGAPAPAQAQRGLGVGIAAGLLGGAIIGGALAAPHYYGPGYYDGPGYAYGPGYGYAPSYGYRPAYVVDPAPYGPCYWQTQRFWDGYGWRLRRIRVCG